MSEEDLFGLFGLRRDKETKSNPQQRTQSLLGEISSDEFEETVAGLYRRMGFNTRRTPKTRDHGIDVFAERSTDSGTERLAIQCKHYPDGSVGVEHARSLYGITEAKQEITRGVIVTSGDFSKSCRSFADGKRIELINGACLAGFLAKYEERSGMR